ncbi:Alpha/Beta hydrolase protein [Radiomyces spectabilis]|uniref:Alpha/Beta hydrolase protein n=1 Tax=Radiomyces spectabilis TaxID=64574 RepID=UPI00221EE277|nr:Alpha/Beta hydrolase protein [Radiomyces spectabilis]KAI8384380.1 Alpha/Beta hydrolase protein [Radiomyces spectabilis]
MLIMTFYLAFGRRYIVVTTLFLVCIVPHVYSLMAVVKTETPLRTFVRFVGPAVLIPIITIVVYGWLAFEVLFWIYFLIQRRRLQQPRYPTRRLTKDERTALFWNCVHTIKDPEEWCVGWFYRRHDCSHPAFTEIRRENFALWFAWAFWHDELDKVRENSEDAAELEWMMNTAESRFQVKVLPGFNDQLQCIRLSLDPVQAVHRPLIMYAAIYCGTALFNTLFLEWSWHMKRLGSRSAGVLWGGFFGFLEECREMIWPSATDSAPKKDRAHKHKHLVYWYYEPSSPVSAKQTPIVFIHGIGAGLLCYGEFMHHLLGLGRPVFCVELPYVAMHMVEHVPTADETVEEIVAMLETHGYPRAVLVGHSLGTAVASWVAQAVPDKVAGMVMIDPICFLLHYHHVGFNFVHRTPKRLLEYLMHYLASRELHISYYISRHFQWFQTIYFVRNLGKEQVSKRGDDFDPQDPLSNTTVFLSEKDGIVDSPLVAQYLQQNHVDARIMPGLQHAAFLINWKWRQQIIHRIEETARNIDDEGIRST